MDKMCHGSIHNRVKKCFIFVLWAEILPQILLNNPLLEQKEDLDILLFMVLQYGIDYRKLFENIVKYLLRKITYTNYLLSVNLLFILCFIYFYLYCYIMQ